jgi:hypothetical protein
MISPARRPDPAKETWEERLVTKTKATGTINIGKYLPRKVMKRQSDDRPDATINRDSPTPIEDTQLSAANLPDCAADEPFRGSNAPAGKIFDERARRQFVRECQVEGLAKGDDSPRM